MNLTIRRALKTDAESIAQILRNVGWFQHMRRQAPDDTTEKVLEHLTMCLADTSHSVYVAETADRGVLGYVNVHWLPYLFLQGPEGYVSELFVGENARGLGVGSKLLQAVEKEARSRGCSRLMLISSNTRESYSRGFYPKRGWDEREIIKNFILSLEPE